MSSQANSSEAKTSTTERLVDVNARLLRIVERLASIREGLNNGNSSAEAEASRLADLASAEVERIRATA